ncbi:MAG: ThuA domain-containing protein [Cytophagaceae bacterium]|nr:ThuA domain-containing protein [Cytophagaceae bacterium]
MQNPTLFLRKAVRFHVLAGAVVLAGVGLTNCKVSSSGTAKNAKPIRVLMVGGGTSHNFGMWYKNVDGQTLSKDGLATVNYVGDPDSILTYLPQADVLYLSNNRPIKDANVRQAIVDFANAGKGLIIAHAAMWYNWKDWPEYNLSVVSGGSRGHDKYGTFEVNVNNPQHPIMNGVEPKFALKDERYYYIPDPAGPGIEVLASSSVAGSDKVFPSVFVVRHPKARIVGIALGHDAESHNIQNYQNLLRNAVKWAARD